MGDQFVDIVNLRLEGYVLVLSDLETTLFTRLRDVTNYVEPGLSRVTVTVLPSAIPIMTLS